MVAEQSIKSQKNLLEPDSINREFAEKENLSWGAKGVLLFLLSQPEDFKINRETVADHYCGKKNGNGLHAINSIFDELINLGYMTYRRYCPKKKRLVHEYKVYAQSQLNVETQEYEKTQEEDETPKNGGSGDKPQKPKKASEQSDKPSSWFSNPFTRKPNYVKRCEVTSSSSNNIYIKNTTTATLTPEKPKDKASREVVVPSLHKLKISDKLKGMLSAKHDEKTLDIVVRRVLNWKSRKNDEAAVFTVINRFDTWNDIETKEDVKEKNLSMLQKLRKFDMREFFGYQVCLNESNGNEYIEFTNVSHCTHFDVKDSEFIQKVKHFFTERLQINLSAQVLAT